MNTADPAPQLDRRQRKTRAALHAALLDLVATKPYAEITVEDVIGRADIARATFYAHYQDKDELLQAVTRVLTADLMAVVADVSWQQAPDYDARGVRAIVEHVDAHRDLYRLILTGGGPDARTLLVDTLTTTATAIFRKTFDHARKPRIPLTLTATVFVGALVLVIERWLDGHFEQNPRALATSFMHAQVGGLEWSLGFSPGRMHYTR